MSIEFILKHLNELNLLFVLFTGSVSAYFIYKIFKPESLDVNKQLASRNKVVNSLHQKVVKVDWLLVHKNTGDLHVVEHEFMLDNKEELLQTYEILDYWEVH